MLPVLEPAISEQPAADRQIRKVSLITLGCPKNQVDSERILGNIPKSAITEDPSAADTIIINTCGFIESAKQESIDTIFQAIALKEQAAKEGEKKEVIVTGCLSERYRDELTSEIPEVDGFYGVNELAEVVTRLTGHYQQVFLNSRRILNSSHYAYLKISEGCNQRCGFCYIPMIRGNLKSRSIEDNYLEAVDLVERGVRELIIVSQDTSSYGYDFEKSASKTRKNAYLIELLQKLGTIDDLRWIRIMYLYPSFFSDSLIDQIGENSRVCNYIDLPIQHISDAVLSNMRRNTSKSRIMNRLEQIRNTIPDAAIRTSIVVGYPGETEEDFIELRDFVQEFKFDRLGVFTYSHEEGTYSYDLADQVPASVAADRRNELMELQRDISLGLNEEKIGRVYTTLVDRIEDGTYIGRTQYDAPEIDNEVTISSNYDFEVGEFVEVRITDAFEYDLTGEPALDEVDRETGLTDDIKYGAQS